MKNFYLDLGMEITKQITKVVQSYLHNKKEIKSLKRENPRGDITLNIDEDVEKIVYKIIKKKNISCLLYGEEFGEIKIGKNPKFILLIDPIDGSHNAKRKVPFFSSTLCFSPYKKDAKSEDIEVGIVRNLINNDTFIGIKGKGAYLNGKRIFSSKIQDLNQSDIILNLENSLKTFKKYYSLIKEVRDVKRFGSSCLEICYCASASVDAFFDPRGKSCVLDVGAAVLIAEESGAIVKNSDGSKFNAQLIPPENIKILVAGNKKLYNKIIRKINCVECEKSN